MISKLLSRFSPKVKGDQSLLNSIEDDFNKYPTLFYPSAGADLTDLYYVRGNFIPELNICSPKIFIHSDLCNENNWGGGISEIKFMYPDFYTEKYSIHAKEKSIHIFKLKRPETSDSFWMIYFAGFYNEEILKFLFDNKINIDVVYSFCDGMTHGIGDFNKKIATILYPLVLKNLNTRFYISEQSFEWAIDIINESIPQTRNDGYYYQNSRLKNWLKNIYDITKDTFVRNLLSLTDEELKSQLLEFLSGFKERKINSDDELRIFYEGRNLDCLVIKTI